MTFNGIIKEALGVCCFGINKVKYSDSPLAGPADLAKNLATVQVLIPVLAHQDAQTHMGNPFLRMMQSPGVTYVTLDKGNQEALERMWSSLAGNWPLLCLSILMSMQAGMVIWFFETWKNREEFPRSCHKGALEGLWWAYVSMTTVGYGDKAPKSLQGRVFGIFWITMGIAISGIFTASLTSALTSSLIEEEINLSGKMVGVLDGTRYENGIALREGAQLKEFKRIEDLKQALTEGSIEGVVIDNLVLRYYWNNLTSNLKLKTQKGLKNTPTAIGAVVLHTRTNDTLKRWSIFLKSFLDNNKDNEPVILALAEKNLTSPLPHDALKAKTLGGNIFNSPEFYKLFLLYTGVSTLVLVFLGLIYEGLRQYLIRRGCKRQEKIHPAETGQFNLVDLARDAMQQSMNHLTELTKHMEELKQRMDCQAEFKIRNGTLRS